MVEDNDEQVDDRLPGLTLALVIALEERYMRNYPSSFLEIPTTSDEMVKMALAAGRLGLIADLRAELERPPDE